MVTVIGGTGFIGRHVIGRLLADGRQVRCTVRKDADAEHMRREGAEPVKADIMDHASLAAAMKGSEAAVNLVGIIRENPGKGITFDRMHRLAVENFVAAAESAGVERLVHMSALGTRPDAESDYHKTKYLGEQEVIGSGIPYVIFRPSAQIGVEGEFTRMMINLVARAPVLPVFGSGLYKMQPMDVDDTAKLFSAAVDNPAAANGVYDVGGPEEMTYLELLDAFAQALGVRRPKLKIPIPLADIMVSAMGILPNPPITRAQYIMLQEGSICDNSRVLRDFPGISLGSVRPILERAAGAFRAG